ncbi:MAG: phage tail tape measure protein, partial [Solirubrobacterales bacterium]
MTAAGGLLPPLILELRSRSGQVRSDLKGVGAEVEALDKQTSGGLGRTGKAFNTLAGVGKVALFGLAGGALAVGGVSLKMGMDFQAATTQLVTGAGESEKNIGMVRKGLLDMAPAVGMGPQALAKAMFLVESAGFHGAAGLQVMKAAAEGAKVGGADATVVANGLTTALTDYHLPAQQAANVTSQLVATVAAGKTNMQDLSGSLSAVLPAASAAHVGLAQVLGALGTMTGEG